MAFFAESSYAEYVALNADKVVAVPDSLTLNQACALLLQGMTAHCMMTSTYVVKPGWCTPFACNLWGTALSEWCCCVWQATLC